MVENPPANAADTGSSPGPGGSHMPWTNWAQAPQLLSLSATTTEVRVPGARALQQREATTMRSPRTTTKSGPRSPPEKSPCAATKTQHSQE